MPTAITTFTTQTRHVPYLTNQQFKLAPTPTPWDSLVPGGSPQEQEEQLTELIARGSTWADSICMQVLAATIDTEQGVVYANRYGQYILRPRYQPALQLTDVWLGSSVPSMTQLADLSACWVEPKRIIVSSGGLPVTSSAGPIQFGGIPGSMGQPTFARWSYANGFAVTTLSEPAAKDAMSVAVGNAAGVIPGVTSLSLRDGSTSEPLFVSGVSGTTLSLSMPLANAHLAGAAVSALPQDAEEAIILAVQGLAKMKGNAAIVANSSEPVKTGSDPLGAGSDLATAEKMLVRGDYQRAVT